ncbi:Nramp family divalent metal transporter [Streptomyces avicenniae]|uniref:Nramp family divalent metal transporter n=1 Tax=Streptomyces avicenniae TaxID=500153 RepID=UPI000A7DFF98|nr:Nramp family divalent metal transporter [Streptomyces avicenniae]
MKHSGSPESPATGPPARTSPPALAPTESARGPGTVRAGPGVPRTRRLVGPAFVAAIAYIDPGNFAVNLTAGATQGYRLLWVVVLASACATLLQYLSAKVGVATGKSLPLLCRERFGPGGRRALWWQGELVVAATEIAEFVGAAIGMRLLFGTPVWLAALLAAAASLLVVALRQRGHTRGFELAAAASLVLVGGGFLFAVLAVGHQSPTALAAGLVPHGPTGDALPLILAMIGATVMPHALYLHSAVVQTGTDAATAQRHPGRVRRALRTDCLLGLGVATLVNASMIVFGAGLASLTDGAWTGDLTGAHGELLTRAGGAAALAFAVALLASGLSSCGVGALAGDVMARDLLVRRIPPTARRLLTLTPAAVLMTAQVPMTHLLVASQVFVSLGVPVAVALLILFSRDRTVMGTLVNARGTTWAAALIGATVAALACAATLGA